MAATKGISGEAVIDEGEELEDVFQGGEREGVGLHVDGVLRVSDAEQQRAPVHLHRPAPSASGSKTALFGQGR